MTALQAHSVTVDLGARRVLSGIDLSPAPGRFTILIGPNGAGKTTLLRALAGLLAPREGHVTLEGAPVARMHARERARSVAYLPQGGTVAWPLPVSDVVALGRLPHGEEPDRLPTRGREAVAAALQAVGLQGFERRPATALSGGGRARVLLARALRPRSPSGGYLIAATARLASSAVSTCGTSSPITPASRKRRMVEGSLWGTRASGVKP